MAPRILLRAAALRGRCSTACACRAHDQARNIPLLRRAVGHTAMRLAGLGAAYVPGGRADRSSTMPFAAIR